MTELFEVFDDAGNPIGRLPRDRVHREGLLHRAVQVFVFNTDRELLLQLRAADKDVYGDRWDSSVGEHLVPGETFIQAAVRGVSEELGVDVAPSQLKAMGGPECMRLTGSGFVDHEEQQLFVCQHDGPFVPDESEVQALRFVGMEALQEELREKPDRFAPWLLQHLAQYQEYAS